MELNFCGDCHGCITVIIHGLIFAQGLCSVAKINPLVTVEDDLCTPHMGQVLDVVEMETSVRELPRVQSDMGGSFRRSVGESEATERIATLWQ